MTSLAAPPPTVDAPDRVRFLSAWFCPFAQRAWIALEEAGACRSGFFTASSLFALLFAVVTPCLFAFVTSDRPSVDAPLAPIGSPWGLPRTPRRSRRPGGGNDSDDEDAASRDTVTV